MHGTLTLSPTGILLLTLSLVAGPVQALDYSSLVQIYAEDYAAEIGFPTTPELDTLVLGGLTTTPSGEPALTGTAARVFVTGGGGSVESKFTTVTGTGVLGRGQIGLRGQFEGIDIVGHTNGSAALTQVGATFDPTSGDPIFVRALLAIFRDPDAGGALGTTFAVQEVDSVGIPQNMDFIDLSGSAEEAALLAGAPFTIDLSVDPGLPSASAQASLDVDGTGELGVSIAISVLPEGGEFVSASNNGTIFVAQPPMSFQVDMTALELWLSGGANLFNIDVGGAQGTPSPAYAAAGGAAVWNTLGVLGTHPLYRGDGTVSPASVTVSGLTVSAPGGYASDPEALFRDEAVDCAGVPLNWGLQFAGLDNGDYDVIVYAPSATATPTGDLTVAGSAETSLPGDPGLGLIQGVSYQTYPASVANGTLGIFGTDPFFLNFCIGIAGVQLERQLPEPGFLTGLVAAIALLHGLRKRRYVLPENRRFKLRSRRHVR
jgi:hypothetical protein